MNLFKKLTIFCLSVAACFSFAFAAACDGGETNTNSGSVNTESNSDSSLEQPSEPNYVYRVSVENPTGFGFNNISVSLKDGDTVVATEKTNSSGYAYFRSGEDAVPLGKYSVVINGLPAGYTYLNADETYETIEAAETTVTIPLMPTGVLDGNLPSGKIYRVGDVIHDFTTTTAEGKTLTLSKMLEEKQLVVINFWALRCGPCKAEFPIMNKALLQYKDSVDCIAFNAEDSKDQIINYKTANKLAFNMTNEYAAEMLADFGVGAIPQTAMIDRYGVVVFNEVGSMTNLSQWTAVFDTFLGDDYVPTVWGADEGGGDVDGPEGEERIEPLVPAPTMDEVKQALNADERFSFRWQAKDVGSKDDENYDIYSWPWVVRNETNKDGKKTPFLRAGNTAIPNDEGDDVSVDYSYATLYADIKANGGDVVVFDYKVGSERNCDMLYVLVDGVIVQKLSGYYSEQWYTCYAYVFTDDEAGEHEITFLYNKDGDKSAYDDEVYIKNLRMETLGGSIQEAKDAHIFRYAATVKNTDEGATTQFKKYVEVFENKEDGYLHVGKADGPILFADLWYATQWSNMSVWQLAFYDYVVVEGFNYHGPFEDYAWAANNNIISDMYMYGLIPVSSDLRELLNIMTKYVPYNAEWDKFNGEWHENEWLEICCYYEPYGETEQLEDPLQTITFDAAVEMFEGSNTVEVPFAINPRGFKYKFIPKTSGVYHVYSTGDTDTYAFLVAGDQKTFLGEWNDKAIIEVKEDGFVDANFEFFWDFEAGETYYMLFTTFGDVTATYNVNIDYIGDTYTYMANAATNLYSTNLVTGALFIPDAIDYTYDEENDCYRYVDEYGNVGSPIYLDILRPTTFIWKSSLYDMAVKYINENTPVKDREFYIKGVDYTDLVREYGFQAAMQSGQYKGYVVVNKEIYDFLHALTVYTDHEGISDSWLTLCYYEKTVGEAK
jgi:thiol-disulfide isomerase/thioredoxin